jgi:hypothetical protein
MAYPDTEHLWLKYSSFPVDRIIRESQSEGRQTDPHI